MRKVLFSLLLATAAATPALARPTDNDQRSNTIENRIAAKQEARAERQQNHEEARPQAESRDVRADFHPSRPDFSSQVNAGPGNRPNFDRPQGSRPVETDRQGDRRFGGSSEQRQWSRPADMTSQSPDARFEGRSPDQRQWSRPDRNAQQSPSRFDGQSNVESVTNWRSHERDAARQERFGESELRGYTRTPPSYARPDRPAPIPETAYRYGGRSPQWNTNWHNDRRYDWRNYREHHRSTFRVGVYYDPFGWGYQRFNVGWRLYPAYYEQNYWLTDPYMYDLPPAPYPLQWVRYYDDALLVNVFTGQVEDVMYDFFW